MLGFQRSPVRSRGRHHVAVDGQGGLESSFNLHLDLEDGGPDQQIRRCGAAHRDGQPLRHQSRRNQGARRARPRRRPRWRLGGTRGDLGRSGVFGLSTCSLGSLDPLLAVYTGTAWLAGEVSVARVPRALYKRRQRSPLQRRRRHHLSDRGQRRGEERDYLELIPAPTNDQFADATALNAGLPEYSFGSNRFASKQPGEPDHGGDSGGASVWYSWTPSASGNLSVCSYDLEPLLAVYSGSTLAGLVPVSGTERGRPIVGGNAGFRFEAVAGTAYRIAVDGKGGDQGSFYLALRGTPANDDFAAATTIEASLPSFAYGGNRLASKQPGEPDHAGNVAAPGSGSNGLLPTAVSGWSTCSYGAHGPTSGGLYRHWPGRTESGRSRRRWRGRRFSSGDSKASFNAVAGTTYRIAVDGEEQRRRIRTAPAPDTSHQRRFRRRDRDPQEPAKVAGTNLDATAQSGRLGPTDRLVPARRARNRRRSPPLLQRRRRTDGHRRLHRASLGCVAPVTTIPAGTNSACDSPAGSRPLLQQYPALAFNAVAGTTYRIPSTAISRSHRNSN